jgi:hypothetical protein
MRHLSVLVSLAVGAAVPFDCFVEYPSSTTTKNMCERAFHQFPVVSNATACANECVVDKTCVMFAWSVDKDPKCRISSSCKEPTNALAGFDGYFRNSTAGACAPDPSPAPGTGTWDRVFLTDAAAKGGVCIDGSPG